MSRVFLLSPAHSGGKRAALFMRSAASFELARQVQIGAAKLGDVFAFCSGLYFRGKLAYAQNGFLQPIPITGVPNPVAWNTRLYPLAMMLRPAFVRKITLRPPTKERSSRTLIRSGPGKRTSVITPPVAVNHTRLVRLAAEPTAVFAALGHPIGVLSCDAAGLLIRRSGHGIRSR